MFAIRFGLVTFDSELLRSNVTVQVTRHSDFLRKKENFCGMKEQQGKTFQLNKYVQLSSQILLLPWLSYIARSR